MTYYHDRQTMERLAHADSELEAAQHFRVAPRSTEEAEMDIVQAVAHARSAVGDALDAVRFAARRGRT